METEPQVHQPSPSAPPSSPSPREGRAQRGEGSPAATPATTPPDPAPSPPSPPPSTQSTSPSTTSVVQDTISSINQPSDPGLRDRWTQNQKPDIVSGFSSNGGATESGQPTDSDSQRISKAASELLAEFDEVKTQLGSKHSWDIPVLEAKESEFWRPLDVPNAHIGDEWIGQTMAASFEGHVLLRCSGSMVLLPGARLIEDSGKWRVTFSLR